MNKKIIYIGLAALVVLGFFAYLFLGVKPDPKKGAAKIEFWGIYDDSETFDFLIKKFNAEYPRVSITYHKENYVDYEKDLVEALAANRGPDIFMIQNSWLPRYQDKISPMPLVTSASGQDMMAADEFKKTFVDVAATDFIIPQQDRNGRLVSETIYALPLYVDTLALYWNKDYFNSLGISAPPKTWDEFNLDVQKLTQKDVSGNILRAGAAFGTAQNVNRANDILTVLMLQTGTKMIDLTQNKATFDQPVRLNNEDYPAGLRSLEFYTDFANPGKKSYTWNNKMDYSIDAFSQGKAAMMINYSYHAPTIRSKDPHLNFAVASLPQPTDAQIDVTLANYLGITVSKQASDANKLYAWIFLKWLTSQASAKDYLYMNQRPTARRDLIADQQVNSDLGVFANQALEAKSWYEVDNLAIDLIFNQMINSVNMGQATAEDAIKKAASDVTVLMQKQNR